jgi:hypothetical protein
MFVDYLKKLNISPDTYLKKVREHMKDTEYDPKKISFSTRTDKKLMYENPDGSHTHFGGNEYKDYHIYKILDGLEFANYRRNMFRKRQIYYKNNTTDQLSPAWLAYYILW